MVILNFRLSYSHRHHYDQVHVGRRPLPYRATNISPGPVLSYGYWWFVSNHRFRLNISKGLFEQSGTLFHYPCWRDILPQNRNRRYLHSIFCSILFNCQCSLFRGISFDRLSLKRVRLWFVFRVPYGSGSQQSVSVRSHFPYCVILPELKKTAMCDSESCIEVCISTKLVLVS